MASAAPWSPFPTVSFTRRNSNPNFFRQTRTGIRRRILASIMAVAASEEDLSKPSTSTKLVTFLGKGGSGKTTSAILSAQYYANAGLNTCLVTHSQDPTAEYLMGCKIGTSPTVCKNNLSAVRLETTKMLLEPLNRMKQADAHLKLSQGVLEGVVGEELGVLPGMDSIFTALAIEKLVGFLGSTVAKRSPEDKFDIIVYDGISNEETLRMIGATERARWYLKYLRNMAEKTEVGRLIAPSLLRLADEAMRLNGGGLRLLHGKMSAEIWDDLEQILERASTAFAEPSRFSCYLMMDPNSPTSVHSALRYWGCAIQSGARISGAFGFAPPQSCAESAEIIEKKFSPLPFALMPYLSMGSPIDWDTVVLREDVRNLLYAGASSGKFQSSVKFDTAKKSVTSAGESSGKFQASVKFDTAKKLVTLFMPGFDKSEIKLYQYSGGSELLVEAGDQRRVIRLPPAIQGKVGGAKFTDRSLVITMK